VVENLAWLILEGLSRRWHMLLPSVKLQFSMIPQELQTASCSWITSH